MTSFGEIILWLGVIFPLVFSAGPGNVLCAVCGANNGFKKSIPFILGLNFSYTLYSLLIGFGLGSILLKFPTIFFIVQLLGVIYIFWLGYKFLIRKEVHTNESNTKLTFLDGVISQALNIKGLTIVITMYSQFLNEDSSLSYEVIRLSLLLLILNLFTHTTWSYGGAWMAQKFASNYAVQVQSKIFGSMLILISLWLLFKAIE
ncbi:LysE family translocator [Poseidonibacter lekithochrous]|uniref:LysE family translocator n=1 Tax=Poseidonibacter TaxID=2321187 RepID=UPI001C090A6A|nr:MULTISPECIES: LysE family translocator [Poseidonibacter]MBU3013906.1 LysE family translocator [Poseidonibacter lekithochrous]MDO6827201.1 LysE family translocator [Poseidonibacter sp. 1_MG-2023]